MRNMESVSNNFVDSLDRNPYQGGQKQRIKYFLLPNMTELFKTNRMSHFPPFYDEFFLTKFNFKELDISFCGNIQARIMQTRWNNERRLAINIDGYPLARIGIVILISLLITVEIPIRSLVRTLAYFLFFRQKVVLQEKYQNSVVHCVEC